MRRKWRRMAAAGLIAASGGACSHVEVSPTSLHEGGPGTYVASKPEAPAESAPETVQLAAAPETAPRAAPRAVIGAASGAATQSLAADEAGAPTPPFDARPGECYARVTQPAVYREVAEEVLVEEAGEREVVVPATRKLVTERRLIEPEQTREVMVPATYKTVVEEEVIVPARERVVDVPAVYETRTRQVLLEEAYTTWKRGVNPIAYGGTEGGSGPDGRLLQTAKHSAGDVMCLVEVPAKYETVTERVMVRPATTRIEVIPAKTRRVTRRVIDQPAQTKLVTEPARYQEITREVIDQPETVRTVATPARYETQMRQEMVEAERSYWTQVLCETNADRQTIRQIQRALRSEGFPPGPIDGIWGPRSDGAARRFQRETGGPRGVVTLETLRKLGLEV